MLIETSVLEAFYECDHYGTAVELLKILEHIGFDDTKVGDMFDFLILKYWACVEPRKMFALFLAADDTLSVFQNIHDADKIMVYERLKQVFEMSKSPEIKGKI